MTMENYTLSSLYTLVSDRVRQLDAEDPRLDLIQQAAWVGQGWVDGRRDRLENAAYDLASEQMDGRDEADVQATADDFLREMLARLEVEEVIQAAWNAQDRAGAPPVFVLGFLCGALGELREHAAYWCAPNTLRGETPMARTLDQKTQRFIATPAQANLDTPGSTRKYAARCTGAAWERGKPRGAGAEMMVQRPGRVGEHNGQRQWSSLTALL